MEFTPSECLSLLFSLLGYLLLDLILFLLLNLSLQPLFLLLPLLNYWFNETILLDFFSIQIFQRSIRISVMLFIYLFHCKLCLAISYPIFAPDSNILKNVLLTVACIVAGPPTKHLATRRTLDVSWCEFVWFIFKFAIYSRALWLELLFRGYTDRLMPRYGILSHMFSASTFCVFSIWIYFLFYHFLLKYNIFCNNFILYPCFFILWPWWKF